MKDLQVGRVYVSPCINGAGTGFDESVLLKTIKHMEKNHMKSKEMKDSGERQNFETGAVRDTAKGKPRPDLISPFANLREGIWLGKGAEKYSERNWEKGMPLSRCIASLTRHIMAYLMGDDDEDHLAAMRCNTGFLLHYDECIKRGLLPKELDDLPRYKTKEKQ